MIKQLLSPEVQSFIEAHQQDDPNDIHLKYKTIFNIPATIIVDQIVGRKKAREKLPTWYNNNRVIYPPSVNMEQSSSEKTALQKMKLLGGMDNIFLGQSRFVDLTGGFGVDAFFFSRACQEIHFVEPNENLLEISMHNHRELGATNVSHYNDTAEKFLERISDATKYDLIYADPSRRSKVGQKVFSLSQCEPDVTKLQHEIWHFSNNFLIKTSPLLDIKQGLKELRHVKKVYVISVNNECKELLFYCEKSFQGEAEIEAINLGNKESSFSFLFSEEQKAEVNLSDPLSFLYEPNASILKSGAFKIISTRFEIYKLNPNTHLYTSDDLIANFPGKVFRIETFVKSDPKELRNHFEGGQANILTRNYPLSVDDLRKKTRLKDGGEKFLIGCSGIKKKFLVVATKLDSL